MARKLRTRRRCASRGGDRHAHDAAGDRCRQLIQVNAVAAAAPQDAGTTNGVCAMAARADEAGGGSAGCVGGAVVADAPPRVLLVASEIFPLAKTGGLGDVCGALPKALRQLGVDVRLLMPGYPCALDRSADLRIAGAVDADAGESSARLLAGRLPDSDIPLWLLDCPRLYQRPGTPYQDPSGSDWPDNARRYAALCRAAVALARGDTAARWRPDLVHCHDWHTGLVPFLLRRAGVARPATVFTVHNAAFQGNFPWATAELLDLPDDAAGLEFYGQLSFLKAGIVYADKVTTVSPTYARELRSREFGCGLEGVFASRGADFVGILNGIDTEVWNPATDAFLARRYSPDDPAGKGACKNALQAQSGLRQDPAAPLAMFASRLTTQKMADVLAERMPTLLRRHATLQFALLGSGEHTLERRFIEISREFPGRAAIEIGYAESTAHRLHAGADLLLHGSRFEPCGLTQMYAMRYGTIPIVRCVGGLADSVADVETDASTATGFVFAEASGRAFEHAIERSLEVYATRPEVWREVRARGLAADFGWSRSAAAYLDLYRQLVPAPSAAARLAAWHQRIGDLARAGRARALVARTGT
jgi:starch synthase